MWSRKERHGLQCCFVCKMDIAVPSAAYDGTLAPRMELSIIRRWIWGPGRKERHQIARPCMTEEPYDAADDFAIEEDAAGSLDTDRMTGLVFRHPTDETAATVREIEVVTGVREGLER